MKKSFIMFFTALLILSSLTAAFADRGNGKKKGNSNELKLGVEILLEEQKSLIEGKRVGLITNLQELIRI